MSGLDRQARGAWQDIFKRTSDMTRPDKATPSPRPNPLRQLKSRPASRTAAGRDPDRARIERALRDTFGMHRLREGQETVIRRVLAGAPTIAIMPTGAGKSLCYQLPAVLIDGMTLVVSPLIALMKDQCDKLAAIGVPAVKLNSAVGAAELQEAEAAIVEGRAKIVFTTPERLVDADFMRLLGTQAVGLVVVTRRIASRSGATT
jgi:ATP-dependent DNA helicase RecQ